MREGKQTVRQAEGLQGWQRRRRTGMQADKQASRRACELSRQAGKRASKHASRQAGSQVARPAGRQAGGRLAGRRAGRQASSQAGKQAGRQADAHGREWCMLTRSRALTSPTEGMRSDPWRLPSHRFGFSLSVASLRADGAWGRSFCLLALPRIRLRFTALPPTLCSPAGSPARVCPQRTKRRLSAAARPDRNAAR